METTEYSTFRLVVEQDDYIDCPRGDWHMLTGFVKISGRGDSRLSDVPAVYDDPTGNIAEAHTRFTYRSPVSLYTDILFRRQAEADALVVRWARIFHDMKIVWDADHGGYWFVNLDDFEGGFRANWPGLVPGTDEHLETQGKVIEQERETYQQWANGEVYIVALERRGTMARVNYNEASDTYELVNPLTAADIQEDWESIDSLGGCYLDDDYTPEMVALEHFELSDDECHELDKVVNPPAADAA